MGFDGKYFCQRFVYKNVFFFITKNTKILQTHGYHTSHMCFPCESFRGIGSEIWLRGPRRSPGRKTRQPKGEIFHVIGCVPYREEIMHAKALDTWILAHNNVAHVGINSRERCAGVRKLEAAVSNPGNCCRVREPTRVCWCIAIIFELIQY